MKRPLIGVNMHVLEEHRRRGELVQPEIFCVQAAYTDALERAGAECVLLPPACSELSRILAFLDGIVLIGGGDYDPELQGCRRTPWNTNIIPAKQEHFDRALLREAECLRTPVLAVGAGMQLLNVVCGGTLTFEIGEDYPEAHQHIEPSGAPVRHRIELTEAARADRKSYCLARAYGDADYLPVVTSRHHQAVDDVAHGFSVTARSMDGIVEAIESDDPDWPAVGVQFHPELPEADEMERQVVLEWVEQIAASVPRTRENEPGRRLDKVA